MKKLVLWGASGMAILILLGVVRAAPPFKITRFDYDRGRNQLTLVWSSEADRRYAIELSYDLRNWKSLTNGISASNAETTSIAVNIGGEKASYFRVVSNDGVAFLADPILTMGHGSFIGTDGKAFKPTSEFILRAQNYYIEKLQAARENGQEVESLIRSLVNDTILANALFIDWMVEKLRPPNMAHIIAVNTALRWHYVLNIQANPVLPTQDNVWSKGIPSEIARKLEEKGVSVFYITNVGGEAYRAQCRDNGVPLPPPMFGPGWQRLDIIDDPFISEDKEAELWVHEAPEGVCLALPRYRRRPDGTATDEIALFGIICLGRETSKVCFFDNDRSKPYTRNQQVDISRFVGGIDLTRNSGDICSDCHAGENPFVVHPEKRAFGLIRSMGISLRPRGWPDPLVDASWPQNPGPTSILDAVPSSRNCTSCHGVGLDAGRFPDISTELPGYCGVVLATAAGTSSKHTMPVPRASADRNLFIAHINALSASCTDLPSGGGAVVEVNLPDDPSHVSPPLIIGPLYDCQTKVAVRGAVLDARLEVFVNGTSVATHFPARNPYQIDLDVPVLHAGEVVTATQQIGGPPSESSESVTVRDHRVDYPMGLPPPEIDPSLIYECANFVAVRHVPGARVTIFTNGVPAVSFSSSTDWSAVSTGPRPYMVGDQFVAEAALCDDVSPQSVIPAVAVSAPLSFPSPTLDPPTTYDGQELVTVGNLVNGALTSLSVVGFGAVGDFSTPVSWFPNFDIATPLGRRLTANDRINARERLCDRETAAEFQPAAGCDRLPAPHIKSPIVGNNYVIVDQSVPGARIRVFDSSGVELGDGSGTVIVLNRILTGIDTLTVVQTVGGCTSRTGYRISARNPSGGNQ